MFQPIPRLTIHRGSQGAELHPDNDANGERVVAIIPHDAPGADLWEAILSNAPDVLEACQLLLDPHADQSDRDKAQAAVEASLGIS